MFKEKVANVIKVLEGKLIEREELIRLTMLCIFARHHMFLIGKPGVGKTYAIQTISKTISDASYWEILMTKETQEKQLVGTEDTPKEQTLLVHPFIFFDEMFKATDELLVALLALLNERRWTIGGKGIPVPLNSLFSASNELPFGEKIEPFSDRILVWYEVQRIQEESNMKNYVRGVFDRTKTMGETFTMADIQKAQEMAEEVEIGEEIVDCYLRLKSEISRNNIKASDRKFGPDFIVRALRVSAVLNDRKHLDYSDLLLLKHMSWTDYNERNRLFGVVTRVIFGDENAIRARLLEIERFYKEAFSRWDAKCFKFIQFQITYSHSIYNDNIQYCLAFQQEAQQAFDALQSIINLYEHSNKVLEQVENNILLWDVKNIPFTPDLLSLMDKLFAEIDFGLKKINQFVENYGDAYAYQEALYNKLSDNTPKEKD